MHKPFALLLLILLPIASPGQQSSAGSVQAVLFFQPFCDQCFEVIDNFLVPLSEEYGGRLRLEPVDVSAPEGLALYQNALREFTLPADAGEQPALIVGDTILRGRDEILAGFRELVEQGLVSGGAALPELPGLTAILEGDEAPAPAAEDGVAMGLAWAVFAVLILSLAFAARQALASGFFKELGAPVFLTFWMPLLALAGLGISAYLSHVELGLGEAACGPVGDCNRVQSSPYSKIFGVPMAFLGAAYYAAFFALWVFQRKSAHGPVAAIAVRALIALSIFGALFSLYLTSLELFVIHAVCMWCLGSALITALLTVVACSAAVGRPSVLQAGTQTPP